MNRVRVFEDPEACRRLWEQVWPQACIFDLWPVRACFRDHFRRPSLFIVLEKKGVPSGLLALSWIEEEGYYGHFPGETWQGKTWLEQNKILAENEADLQTLLESVPGRLALRYLDNITVLGGRTIPVDEVGYLFFPKQYDFRFENYLNTFSGKSRKTIRRELERLHERKVSFRYNHLEDVDRMLAMNLEAFGEGSFFHDTRFYNAFIDLITWLHRSGGLRLTSVIIGGRLAAVDVGAVWQNTYTVMGGGTHPDFPGVAKLINFHHLEWACQQRLALVDFLCGEFNWKARFHLNPRPLYKLSAPEAQSATELPARERSVALAR